MAPVSVPELLTQVRELTRPVMEKYGTSLEITCNGDILPVDKDLMCIALVNLVENSAKASAPGQTIQIQASETGFTVTDHGRGHPRKRSAKSDRPLLHGRPLPKQGKRRFRSGTGAGAEIAAVHGGTLVLESTLGEGTTARIVIGNQTVTCR